MFDMCCKINKKVTEWENNQKQTGKLNGNLYKINKNTISCQRYEEGKPLVVVTTFIYFTHSQ